MTADALGVIYLPLRPALHAGCAAIACRPLRGWVSWLESGTIVGIASPIIAEPNDRRSEEHTSELQSRQYLVCRLLLEKKTNKQARHRAAVRRGNRQDTAWRLAELAVRLALDLGAAALA